MKIEVILGNCISTAALVTFLAFLFTLLRQPRNFLYWFGIASALSSLLIEIPNQLEWIRIATYIFVSFACIVPLYAVGITILVRGALRGNRDAALLLGPIALSYLADLFLGLIETIQATGHSEFIDQRFQWFFSMSTWPFPFSVPNALDGLMQLSVLAILVLRFARTRRDEERLKTEFESARVVQQVLIPDEVPSIPGFAIQCVYKPAGQVGGDFFQVISTKQGGALIVIGDVSGKGMPAAMAVSLLVGTVRTLAHYTQSPGEILAAMNQRMLARSSGGFTTCLVLHVESNGAVTVANAGHLAPYLQNKEIALENGLPLGLLADSAYAESAFQIGFNEQLTLLTDGVVEARAKSKELFGFERTASMATESAEFIAQVAVAFGQEDDVTVLTLCRQVVAAESTVQIASPILTQSPAS